MNMDRRCGPARRPLLSAALAVLLQPALGSADGVRIEPAEKWSNVFGQKKVALHFTVKATEAFKGRVGWALLINNRTVPGSPGEADVAVGSDGSAEVKVRLHVPPVREGVVLRAQLVLSVHGGGQRRSAATHTKTLWIFPADPFAGQKEWLRRAKIRVFDPAKTTARLLQAAQLPLEVIDAVSELDDLKDGVLIVGQAASFKDQPELSEKVAQAAARGLRVLVLPPADGTLLVPGVETAQGLAPGSLSFRRTDVITELDKRLDAEAWPAANAVVIRTVALRAEDGRVVAEVGRRRVDWPWLEARFPDRKGALVYCGFGIVGKAWDESPAPRFLLARILERLAVQE
jgi:hypothetical protein